MNLNQNPSIIELISIIKSCDDNNFNHIIWVSKVGNVLVEKFTTNNPASAFEKSFKNKLKFWLGVFHRGNGYVGEHAANDDKYLNVLFKNLMDNWKNDFQGHVEI